MLILKTIKHVPVYVPWNTRNVCCALKSFMWLFSNPISSPQFSYNPHSMLTTPFLYYVVSEHMDAFLFSSFFLGFEYLELYVNYIIFYLLHNIFSLTQNSVYALCFQFSFYFNKFILVCCHFAFFSYFPNLGITQFLYYLKGLQEHFNMHNL